MMPDGITRLQWCNNDMYFFQGNKLWGGRFTGQVDPIMKKFDNSIPYDQRMWKQDLNVNTTA